MGTTLGSRPIARGWHDAVDPNRALFAYPAAMPKPPTPMMARYLEVKAETPGALLLFRMGDFFETFYDDAETIARLLQITLTSRDKGSENPVPMAGFPHHALSGHLSKLVGAGHRVAICDQVEDPKEAKGLVRREVTRIVTPGTITDETMLDPRQATWTMAACGDPKRLDKMGLAWADASTGRFVCGEIEPHQLAEEMARVQPAELLVPEGYRDDDRLAWVDDWEHVTVTTRPPWAFSPSGCCDRLLTHFRVGSLEGYDVPDGSTGIIAAGCLMEYLEHTQRGSLRHITALSAYRRGTAMMLDETARRSLELTRTLRDNQRDGSLLEVIDHTVTPMGARLLAEWLESPLTDADAITLRLDAVGELVGSPNLAADLRSELRQTYDLQRLTARVATARATPRDLSALRATLAKLPRLKAKLAARRTDLLIRIETRLDLLDDLRVVLDEALDDEPPVNVADGHVIRAGFSDDLDEFRDLQRNGKRWIATYQQTESERTGIPSLKVGYNKVFGYYLEVTAANLSKVPPEYIRKQTLKNQERFITPELKEYEDKVLQAESRAQQLETELFEAIRTRCGEDLPALQGNGELLARLDVLCGLATLATSRGYCRPEITAEPLLDIREGRHPVLDQTLPPGQFVPNDIRLGLESEAKTEDAAAGRIQLITGPNMAGKSTYIRQAALLTILAQIGSWVPAASARIGLADRVFARVGASDELARGQSTFMVEMVETARVLNGATEKSLVILDEIGRGTSTYDGVSLAWAIAEHLHDGPRCRTLFATHYHELTELSQTKPGVANWNVAVAEQSGEVVFLHRIVPGGADRSYGIHVAELAGLPKSVIDRAESILRELESGSRTVAGAAPGGSMSDVGRQFSLFGPEDHPAIAALKSLELSTLNPANAVRALERLRAML